MKEHRILSLIVTTIAFVSVSAESVTAHAASNSPSSLRGYYIGGNHLLWVTKKSLHEGAPQADVYSYHIRSVSKSGNTYKFRTRFTLGNTIYPTIKIRKTGYHKVRLVGMASMHKVTKAHYYRYANGGY